MKKIIGLCLILTTVFGMTTMAYADTSSTSGDLDITQMTENVFLMSNGDSSAVMHIADANNQLIITVEEENSSNYFVYDKSAGTIYSSITGSTVALSNLVNTDVNTRAVGDIIETGGWEISYAGLLSLVTPTSSDYQIASAIMTILTAAQGITVGFGAIAIVTLLGLVDWDAVRAGIQSGLSTRGIIIMWALVEIEKHQGGKWVTGYQYQLEDAIVNAYLPSYNYTPVI